MAELCDLEYVPEGVFKMRKPLAEAVREMFLLVAVNQCASAKQLRSIALKADLTKDELVFVDRCIREFMKRRSRLNRQLAVRGDLGVMKMLAHAECESVEKLELEDVILDVGPFSYNVYVKSDKLSLICESLSSDNRGLAVLEDNRYPWSIIVTDRIKRMCPEAMLLALIKGEMSNSATERHEDMHQFYAFLQMVSGTPEPENRFCDILERKARLDLMKKMSVPEMVLNPAREKLDEEIAKLSESECRDCADWNYVEKRAREEFVASSAEKIKSELLAFLWSCDMYRAEQRLNLAYLRDWVECAERKYCIDLSNESAKLSSMIAMVILALENQLKVLKDSGIKDEKYASQLMAILNIDRLLDEWGTDA